MELNFHEDLKRAAESRGSSDLSFGLVIAAALSLLALAPLRTGGHLRLPALFAAAVFLLVSVVRPSFLNPLNRGWTVLGLLLGRIVNPIVTALLFFLVFAPAGLIARLRGKDPLGLKPAREKDSYWILRHPPGPQPDSMSKQF
jgi:Saxitoxin biosynthesis operon protein SxtJ